MIIETRRQIRNSEDSKKANEFLKEYEENPDKEFMEKCAEIDKNPPETWAKYPNDPMGIVVMEYNELIKASNKVHEIYHLSAALLRLWRHINKK